MGPRGRATCTAPPRLASPSPGPSAPARRTPCSTWPGAAQLGPQLGAAWLGGPPGCVQPSGARQALPRSGPGRCQGVCTALPAGPRPEPPWPPLPPWRSCCCSPPPPLPRPAALTRVPSPAGLTHPPHPCAAAGTTTAHRGASSLPLQATSYPASMPAGQAWRTMKAGSPAQPTFTARHGCSAPTRRLCTGTRRVLLGWGTSTAGGSGGRPAAHWQPRERRRPGQQRGQKPRLAG
jgi:hypothetical protein